MKRMRRSPATMSESSESPATAEALPMFALKENSDQQSPIVARSLLRWMVAILCCMNHDQFRRKIVAFCKINSVCPSIRLSVTSRSTAKIGLWLLWEVDRKSPQGYSGTHLQPVRPPLSPNWGLTTPSYNLHSK